MKPKNGGSNFIANLTRPCKRPACRNGLTMPAPTALLLKARRLALAEELP